MTWVALVIANPIDSKSSSRNGARRSEGGVVGASHVTCSKKHGVNNVSMRGVQNSFLQHGGVCETSMRIAG